MATRKGLSYELNETLHRRYGQEPPSKRTRKKLSSASKSKPKPIRHTFYLLPKYVARIKVEVERRRRSGQYEIAQQHILQEALDSHFAKIEEGMKKLKEAGSKRSSDFSKG